MPCPRCWGQGKEKPPEFIFRGFFRICSRPCDAAEAHARIADTRADLIKWMLAALTAQTALLLGALRLF